MERKRIIITGATKGLGLATAHEFAGAGFDLAINSRNAADLSDFKQTFEAQYPGIEVLTRPTDMSVIAEVKAFGAFINDHWSHIDVLINNAGVFLPGSVYQEEEGTLEKLIETNVYSAYYLTRVLMPTFLKQGYGHIFNMCSVASIMAYPNGGSYSISKFALLGFSKALREELKDKAIKVTSILPGAAWSDSWKGVDFPEDRLMQASDVAKAIFGAYQLSPAAVVEDLILRPQKGDL